MSIVFWADICVRVHGSACSLHWLLSGGLGPPACSLPLQSLHGCSPARAWGNGLRARCALGSLESDPKGARRRWRQLDRSFGASPRSPDPGRLTLRAPFLQLDPSSTPSSSPQSLSEQPGLLCMTRCHRLGGGQWGQ